MSRAIQYMHSLEQLAGELRDAAEDMEEFLGRLKTHKASRTPVDELRFRYQDYLEHSATQDVIDRLNALVQKMKTDDELQPEVSLEPDMIACNRHALRLCTAQLDVSKILAGTD